MRSSSKVTEVASLDDPSGDIDSVFVLSIHFVALISILSPMRKAILGIVVAAASCACLGIRYLAENRSRTPCLHSTQVHKLLLQRWRTKPSERWKEVRSRDADAVSVISRCHSPRAQESALTENSPFMPKLQLAPGDVPDIVSTCGNCQINKLQIPRKPTAAFGINYL